MAVLSGLIALRRWAWASLFANMVLVFTGGLVRLTKSGLGCPTWPQCEPGSYLPRAEAGLHGAIEFGNRTLTFVLIAVAVGTMVTAWRARDGGRPRRDLRVLATVAALGIPLQALIGGWSVLSQLNPWVVGLHLLLSVAIIGLCVVLLHRAYGTVREPVNPATAWLARGAVLAGLAVIEFGTIVTGAGPHSGDGAAQRNGFDTALTAKIHAASVWALVILTVLALISARAHQNARRAIALLLGVEMLQGVVGYTQYFNALPLGLVATHMIGTAAFAAALTHVAWTVRRAPSS